MSGIGWRQWTTLGAALFLLNVSLSFENLWPTPAVRWGGAVSIEAAIAVLVIAALGRLRVSPSRGVLRFAVLLWMLLTLGRYADVTAPALYGRDVNLYWDLRYIPDVASMLIHAAPLWLVALSAGAGALVLAVLYAALRWTLGRVAAAALDRNKRLAMSGAACAAIALFAAQHVGATPESIPTFTPAVSTMYARQARFLVTAFGAKAGRRETPPSPPLDSDLRLVKGADVVLMFIESYGAVAFDRPELAKDLAVSRRAFEQVVRSGGREVVSAFVESPTFGGSSWFAHLSLLSGIDGRDPEINTLLMTEKRDTMVTVFGRQGFHTVGVLPGLKKSWPEGTFYGFDEVFDAKRLKYRGPWFGWFEIPDQFTLARVGELIRQADGPSFIFFPTLSTHFPFGPTPPYQENWDRVLTDDPYDAPILYRALGDEPDWKNLGPSYAGAMKYAFQSIAGFLQQPAPRDLVLILIGDHQPPAAVSGEHARWDVPVHIITNRGQVLDRLLTHGFERGMTPIRRPLGRMHTLLPRLLSAFGNPVGE